VSGRSAARPQEKAPKSGAPVKRRRQRPALATGRVAWTPLEAVVVLAAMVAFLVAKEAALGVSALSRATVRGAILGRAGVLTFYYLAQLGMLVVLARRHGAATLPAFGLGRPRVGWLSRLTSAALVAGLLVGMRLFSYVYGVTVNALGWRPPVGAGSSLTAVFGPDALGLALAVAMAVVVGPIVEEMVFRSVLLGGIAARWGEKAGIVGSALLFASFHVTPWMLVPAAALGIATGWLARSRRSLWPAVVLHSLYNGVAVAAAFYVARR